MQFQVIFENPKGNWKAVYSVDGGLGTVFYNRCRKELDCPTLDPRLIRDAIKQVHFSDVPCLLTLDQALRAGPAFAYKWACSVKLHNVLPEEVFAEYGHLEVRFDRDPQTGAYTSIWALAVIDEQQMIEDWIKAGAPLDWDLQGISATMPQEPLTAEYPEDGCENTDEDDE